MKVASAGILVPFRLSAEGAHWGRDIRHHCRGIMAMLFAFTNSRQGVFYGSDEAFIPLESHVIS